MSIFLYQIGMDRITAKPTSFAGLQVDMPRTFKTNVSQGFGNPKAVFSGFATYPEPLELNLSGTFLCSCCQSVSDQFNRLLSMGGRPHVDIIGYIPNDCCSVGESCGTCGNCTGDGAVTWMTTTGVIESIERSYTLESGGEYPGSMMEVSFKLTLDAYWYPLNPYSWFARYDTEPYDSFRTDPVLTRSPLPVTVTDSSTFYFWKRNYPASLEFYDPTLWPEIYKFDDALASTYVESPSATFTYRVRSPRTRWSAQPSSMYAFRNLPAEGEINIQVRSEISPFYVETFQSTLDLSTLADLFVLTDIEQAKVSLIVTDSLYRPGFMMYEGEFFSVDALLAPSTDLFIPAWDYETAFPGELLGVDNYVDLTVPAGVEMAYLHTFKGL